jgi:hypothetical protein
MNMCAFLFLGLGDARQGKHFCPARRKQHGVHHRSARRRGHALLAGHHQVLHEDCQPRRQVRPFYHTIIIIAPFLSPPPALALFRAIVDEGV